MEDLVIVNPEDNVALANVDLAASQSYEVDGKQITIKQPVSAGNKLAVTDLEKGTLIIKLGLPIGKLSSSVKAGELIDKHNLQQLSDDEKVDFPKKTSSLTTDKDHKKTFMGYRRANGTVGIRNDLYIIPTVGCITPLMDIMVQEFKAKHPNNGSFDNVILLKHPYGCSQLGDDFEQTREILCDAVMHPNAGGVLVFGLGCENNQMDGMKEQLTKMGGINPKRMKFLVAQEVKDEFAIAQKMLEELNDEAANDHREEIPISELKIGIQDSRSDQFSVLTSDRLLAALADYINSNGGITTLTGYPTLAAGKDVLIKRAKNEQVAKDIDNSFKEYVKYRGQFDKPLISDLTKEEEEIDVSTVNERAANAIQTAGHASVAAAVPYGRKLEEKGLNLIYSPDNALIDESAAAAAGCQLVIVSTGKGTPYASYIPTVKVSSNSKLAAKKLNWIDFDGGQVESDNLEEVSSRFIDYILQVASGKETNNELYGLHGLAIFKMGVTE